VKRDLSFERAIAFAAERIRIPSLPGEEEKVAWRIFRELQALGFDDADVDRAGNVTGRICGTDCLDLDSAREAFDAYPALIRTVQEGLVQARGIPVRGVEMVQTG
jgi:hypothetical protein